MVREKSGKSQGILLYSDCGHPLPHCINKVMMSPIELKTVDTSFALQ